MAFGECGCVRGFFGSHINSSSATAHMRGDKARRWLHNSRCSDSHEDGALLQRMEDAIQLEWHFAEPADVRANPTAAFASWDFGWRFVEIGVGKWSAAASVAAALEKLPVHVDDVSQTCLLVKAVDVLGADEKAILHSVLKIRDGEVSRIRFGCRSNPPPHGIGLPHQPGIASPCMG